jgi:nicotinate phosphoribosyltransferase
MVAPGGSGCAHRRLWHGVGPALDTSSDSPSLDAVYKIQTHGGVPRCKRSESKATWLVAKQMWCELHEDADMRSDPLQLID